MHKSPPIEIESAPAYELLLSLAVTADVTGEHTYEIQPDWSARLKQERPDLLLAIHDLATSDMVWAHLLPLAYETPPPRDVPGFIDHVVQTDARELKLRMLGYYVRSIRRRTPPEIIARAADGDPAAQREFLLTSTTDDAEWQTSVEHLLRLDAEPTKHAVTAILREWASTVWPELESRALPAVECDAERVREVLQAGGAEAALSAALPGFDYVSESGIERVVLVPSFVVRPQIYTIEHAMLRFYAYPVADSSLSAEADMPSPRLLRLLKALADERRLRVLHVLADGSYTLQELADRFEIGNTTMLHHMIILRSAGLVRVRSDRGKRYTLERAVLPQVGALIETYLAPRPMSREP